MVMEKKTLNSDFMLGAIITLVFIGFSLMRPSFFETVEAYIYDSEMKLVWAEDRAVPKVGLINIDDKSLANLGSWPWSRQLIAQMIDLLNDSGAEAIGIHVPFTEKESNPTLTVIESFQEKFNAYPFGEKDLSRLLICSNCIVCNGIETRSVSEGILGRALADASGYDATAPAK